MATDAENLKQRRRQFLKIKSSGTLEEAFEYFVNLLGRERLEARLEVVKRARAKHGRDAWGKEESNLERALAALDKSAAQEEGVERGSS